MFARIRRREGGLEMEVVGGRDDDSIDGRASQKLRVAGVCGGAEFTRKRTGAVERHIGDPRDTRFRQSREDAGEEAAH